MITSKRKDLEEELTHRESQKTVGKGDCFNIKYLLCNIWMVIKRNLRSLCFE